MASRVGVGGHAYVVERQASVFIGWRIFSVTLFTPLGLDQTDGEAAQAGDILRGRRSRCGCGSGLS
jgi:hypothetical protein